MRTAVNHRLARAILVTTVALGLGAVPSIAADDQVETGRVAGADRFGTAVAISQHEFPDGAPRVYLARSGVFADALAAGALTDGPILLVPGGCGPLPPVVLSEVTRLDPAQVVALGGDSAVCEATLETAAQGRETDRLGGLDRFGTAVAVAAYEFAPDEADTAYIVNSGAAPDAVAGGGLTDGPILPVRSEAVPTVVSQELDRLGSIGSVVALGGTSVVSDQVLHAAAAGRLTDRLAGLDRYGTAVQVAERSFPQQADAVYLARGDDVADAVAAGTLTDGPVLLVRPGCQHLPEPVLDYLMSHRPAAVYALGGKAAVCDDMLEQVELLLN